jgi:hypothetical protein
MTTRIVSRLTVLLLIVSILSPTVAFAQVKSDFYPPPCNCDAAG